MSLPPVLGTVLASAVLVPFASALAPASSDATLRELAGKPLAAFPHFQSVKSFNAGEPIQIALDPATDTFLAKRVVEVFLLAHEKLPLAQAGKKLATLAGPPLRVRLTQGGVEENTFLLDTGTLSGAPSPDEQGTFLLGRGYDVVVDVDLDGGLGARDLIDGSANEAGFYVVDDFVTFKPNGTRESGPYGVTEVLFDGGSNFTQEDVYYPSNVAELGTLPMIVVAHGNGHNYQWYDHIGYHMASWGYVVMSHANNTGPGIETASTSTLRNTELFLTSLAAIGDGALQGHVDSHRIVWIGHSRGGEGVVRAYRRLSEGTPLAVSYGLADIKLVSSIAPTDFLGPGVSDMGATPYHLWTGGADADVNGCADCDICQTFHQLERADGTRYSTSLHGAGHGDFHSGQGSSVAQGPRQIGRQRTHQIMRGYFLPLVQEVLDGNPACLDYLTRQWEEFHALGEPDPALAENVGVVVDMMYVPGPERVRAVIDDFQSQPALDRSSSGGAVAHSAGLEGLLAEGRYDDANRSFNPSLVDVMNGMTFDGPGDTSAGAVLEWNATDEWLAFEVPAGARDLRELRTLSFRAAQSTRDELTVAEAGDLDFAVELTDGALHTSTIRIGAYGGGIEEPYQRNTCGQGSGWGNEFESIRIPLRDFQRDGTPLDLSDVVAITFLFGPAHGSPSGRIGLDEILVSGD
jgi:hypothetical protein